VIAGIRPEHFEDVARIDPASDIAEGDEAEFWLDTSRIHYFDAETGENLLRAADELPPEDLNRAGEQPPAPAPA
jgi:multiple sugar transport system ATP-binding protein